MSSNNSQSINQEPTAFSNNTSTTDEVQEQSQLFRANSLSKETKNNTSSAFELPSEFKTKWENLITELILDAFGDFFDRVQLLVPLIQFSLRVVQKIIRDTLRDKLNNVIQLFNLKIDDQTSDDLQNLLKPFLKNNYKDIFKDETLFDVFYTQYLDIISQGYFSADEYEEIIDGLDSNKSALKHYFNQLKNIILYMQINEPPILLEEVAIPDNSSNLEGFHFHKYYSDSFSVIDGFDKEGSPSLIVLNNPKINNGSFAGIKPAVIILSKIPPGFNAQLIDLKQPIKSIPQLDIATSHKQINSVQVFKVQRDIIHTPKQAKTFQINLENQKHQSSYTPLIVELMLPKPLQTSIQQSHIPIITNEVEEGSLSDDCLDREMMNRTENDILQDFQVEDHLLISETRMQPLLTCDNYNDHSMLINSVNEFQPYQEPVMKNQGVSRSNSQNNISLTHNRSFENIFLSQQGATCKTSTKLRKNKNQSLYENLNLIEKSGNYQQSRFIQCSLNFSKFLRNIVSVSPNPACASIRRDNERSLEKLKQAQAQAALRSMRKQEEQRKVIDLNYESIKSGKGRNKESLVIDTKRLVKPNIVKHEMKNPCKTKNVSVSRHQLALVRVEQQKQQVRKKSIVQERIIKQGSVLKRKSGTAHVYPLKKEEPQQNNFFISSGSFKQQINVVNKKIGPSTGGFISPKNAVGLSKVMKK